MNSPQFTQYWAWDLPVRLFHWINFLSVFSLIAVALIMMYKQELGITGVDAKVGLKTLHVAIATSLWSTCWCAWYGAFPPTATGAVA